MPYRRSRLASAVALTSAFFLPAPPACAQSAASATWSVTIVLSPTLVAGGPATLAVFGADGRLASGVTVETSRDQRVTTDSTGRATFTAPAQGDFLLARSLSDASVALLDTGADANAAATAPSGTSHALVLAPVISLKDRFTICGGGFRGDADANRVQINAQRALILAASPACLVVLPGPKSSPGPVVVTVQTGDTQRTAASTLVTLEYDSPAAMVPGKKTKLAVRVRGTGQSLRIVVENQTPGVLRFVRGDTQEVRTSGGVNNFAEIEVQPVRSGDYSFHARLVPPPDPSAAQRYLRAAEPLAPKDLQHRLRDFADRLARHPNDSEKIRRQLDRVISSTIAGDLRTLLQAAEAAL